MVGATPEKEKVSHMSDADKTEVQVQVDDFAPETATYRHTVCGVEIQLAKNNRIPPCYRKDCNRRDAPWVIVSDDDCSRDDAGA